MADAKTDSVWHLVSTFTVLRKKLSNDFWSNKFLLQVLEFDSTVRSELFSHMPYI